ncbi:MAG TPA: hypothetical protein VGC13_02025 [Longimicrobium sp.]|jgi:hypothetical protein|uniref:hypothetical protein n=1 Tax=Longimicrobium sp. TaxID=2029185 RepID=UPI002ED7C6DB
MSEQNPGATVHDLIRLRAQLTGWIARLDEVGPRASSRAAERIRADYASRLRRVNEDLSSHRGEIEADLQRFRGALAQAEEQRLSVADELDEVSLRHLIGELDEAAWNEARTPLEARVRDAEDAVASAREEVERLEVLAADISRAETAAASASAPPAPAPVADEAPAVAPQPAPAADEGLFGGPFDRDATDDFEPDLPDDFPTRADAPAEAAFQAPPAAEPAPEAPPVDVREAAEAASVDEWDPFGSEFSADARQGDAEEDLPWLEGIDQAAASGGGGVGGWTPPAAGVDEGLDFLREIEESTRPPAPPPPSGDLGADDLAFLEELDRAIGSGPGTGGRGAARTPPPAEPAAPAKPAAGAGQRAEPLLCKECGAINEPHSWYCEICGSEL